jgi:hypothetical protein
LSDTFFSLAGRSEDARWILDACSEVGNFKGAPVNERNLFPKLRLRAGNERDKNDAGQASGKPPHEASICVVEKIRHKTPAGSNDCTIGWLAVPVPPILRSAVAVGDEPSTIDPIIAGLLKRLAF